MKEQPIHENIDAPPLHLFEAALSLFCPGLGQLAQKRFKAFLGHFAFFLASIFVPAFSLVVILTSFPKPKFVHFFTVFLPYLWPFYIFPLFLVFFSIIDAVIWIPGKPSRLRKPVRNLALAMIAFYVVVCCFFPTFISGCVISHEMMCRNNMKNLSLALLNYEISHKHLPPPFTVDENGKPLHSWRVLILPYIEENALYKKIRLDEPWDSEYNRQFHSERIRIFECPSQGIVSLLWDDYPNLQGNGNCYYSVVLGEQTAFPGTKKVSLDDISEQGGAVNTVLLVERLTPINWMDPTQEIPYEIAVQGINRNISGCGSVHFRRGHLFAFPKTGMVFCTCNGDARFVPDTISEKSWKAALTVADDGKIAWE